MSFFKNIFGGSDTPKETPPPGSNGPSITFGRYTDANKRPEIVAEWDKSVKLFQDKKYLDAHEAFFRYISDPEVNNVSCARNGDRIDFTVTQGSKVIKGYSDGTKVQAEASIARFEKPSVAFMRKLMNMNYALQYSRFAIKEDKIMMRFSSHLIDASPNKMYYSLKELCTKADRQDNLLTEEFSMLKSVDEEHVTVIPDAEKEIKYKYLVKWINDAIKRASELDESKFGGAISYLLLNAAYRIDYLLCPEGVLMNDMEKIHSIYFAKDNRSWEEKNRDIIAEFNKIIAKPKEYFFNSFYRTKATFGIVTATDHKTVADFLYNETANTNWYRENKYPDIVKCIYEYVAGYALFNYGLYRATSKLMHLVLEINNQDFFTELGFAPICNAAGIPELSKIEERVGAIIRKEKMEFPNLDFMTKELKYTSLDEFCASFVKEFDYLNFSKQPAQTNINKQ